MQTVLLQPFLIHYALIYLQNNIRKLGLSWCYDNLWLRKFSAQNIVFNIFNNHTSFSWWCWKGTLCSAVWLNHFCRIMRIGSWSIEACYYLIFCNRFFNVLQIFPIPSNYPRCLHEYFRIIYFWDEVVLP